MTPYITEILEQINKDPELVLTKYIDNYAVKTIFEYAFDKTKKMVLPEGEPPYKKDTAPLGMSPGNFYQQVKKFYIFLRQDLTAVRREQLFIQLLESLHPTESAVCVAIKDQALTSLYPNITAKLAVKAGWVSEENVFRQRNVQKKNTEGTTTVVKLSDTVEVQDKLGAQAPVVKTEDTPVVKRGRGRPKKVKA
jgi:hypothetical protein